jgi:hypothetical protein
VAFPTTPLDIVVALAPGADPVDSSGWVFADVSDDVRSNGGVEITVGRQDETADVNATSVAATFDNRAGDYCRTNPLGAYYGQLSRGTPMEVRVTRINDTFTRTTSPGLGTDTASGLAWTHDAGGWATTGSAGTATLASANLATSAFLEQATGADVEITGTVSLSAVTTGAAWVHAIIVRATGTGDYYRLHVEFGTGGAINCKIALVAGGSGTDLTSTTSASTSYSAGTSISYRARVVGTTLQIRAWATAGTEPTTWTCEADDGTYADAGYVGIYSWRVFGNTNVGSLTSTFDNYRVDIIRAITPVPEWPARWDRSTNNATAPVTGAGILRRLSQGQPALRSPIYRQLAGLTSYVQGYWPLEDGADATRGTNAVSGRPPATVVDGSFGATTGPPGGSSALTLNTAASSRVQGTVPSWTITQDGYACMFYVTMPAAVVGGIGFRLMELQTTGTIARWTVDINDTSLTVTAYNTAGAVSFTSGPTAYGLDVTEPWAIQLEARENGGNVDWALYWHTVGSTGFGSMASSYAGTADRIITGTAWAPVDGTVVSHLWLGDDLLPFVDTTFMRVSNGYAGETAGARLVRLAAEGGVPLTVIGDITTTSPMGPQDPATLLEAMRQCQTADQGVLHERGAGLGYLTRQARINTDPVMELDFASGHVASPPQPVDDDQRLRNRIVLRSGGSEVTAEDADSIAVDGVYADEIDVNLAAYGQMADHAYWRLHLGTLDGLRWPAIQLNLARNPSLIDEWCRVRIGSRITIANPPDQVGTDSLDLIVEGWTERLTDYGWDVTITCSPAEAWKAGVFDSATSRWGLKTGTTVGSHSSSATTITVGITSAFERLSATSAYDIVIAGERIGVPIGGAGSRTGSLGAWQQVLTGVTRAKNGISKTLPAGSPVTIHETGRWAILWLS